MNRVAAAIKDAQPAPVFTRVPLDGLMNSEPPQHRDVLEPVFPRREVTLLGGHGGIGKSILALSLGAHVAAGSPWGPFHAVMGKVGYVSLEDEPDTARYRLRWIVETYGLDAEAVSANLALIDGSNSAPELAFEAMDEVTRTKRLVTDTRAMLELRAEVRGLDLIMIDGASDAYGGNENERRQVRTFVRALRDLARENNAALVLLAHIDKSGARYGTSGNSYSGSTAWHNSVRSRLALLQDEAGALVLQHEKCQFCKPAEPVPLQFVAHGVLVPQDARAREAAATRQADTDAAAVLTVMRIALAAGATVSTAKRGSATGWHTLCDYPELADEYKTKAGKQRVSAALVRLERDGRVTKESYRDDHRNPRERYKLTQAASISSPKSAPAFPPIPPCVTNARPEGALVPPDALVSTDAKLTKLTKPTGRLADAGPEIGSRFAAPREQGAQP